MSINGFYAFYMWVAKLFCDLFAKTKNIYEPMSLLAILTFAGFKSQ